MGMNGEQNKQDLVLQQYHQSKFGGAVMTFVLRVWFVLLPMVYTEYITHMETPIIDRVYYFTQISLTLTSFWAFFATAISLLNAFKVQLSEKILRIYQIIFQFSFASQLVIVLVYWTAVHPTLEEEIRNKGEGFRYSLL